jgi:hypothetical protein
MKLFPGVFASGALSVYKPSGVHFDGATSLSTASFNWPDAPTIAMSYWFQAWVSSYGILWVSDPNNSYENWFAMETGFEDFDIRLGDPPLYTDDIRIGSSSFSEGAPWHHILFAAKTNIGGGNNRAKIYLDDADITDINYNPSLPFNILMNGLPFYIGDDTFNDQVEGNVADLWISGDVDLFTGSSIAPATRRLFSTAANKPTIPASFPGTAAVLMSGSASAFPINQGNGGAFVINGGPPDHGRRAIRRHTHGQSHPDQCRGRHRAAERADRTFGWRLDQALHWELACFCCRGTNGNAACESRAFHPGLCGCDCWWARGDCNGQRHHLRSRRGNCSGRLVPRL